MRPLRAEWREAVVARAGTTSQSLSWVTFCTLASISDSALDFARGARSAPRPSLRAQHGGGAARSLRRGAASGALPEMEAQMRARQSTNSKSLARFELFARQHRSCPTESEAVLWSALKARQLGVSFRRQVPVAELFIADFLAPSIKLIVEVDGAIHARKQGSDARRDRKLQRAGFRLIRLSAQLVLSDIEAVLALVRAAL
jgi:very-short-patch-repair endonuclease